MRLALFSAHNITKRREEYQTMWTELSRLKALATTLEPRHLLLHHRQPHRPRLCLRIARHRLHNCPRFNSLHARSPLCSSRPSTPATPFSHDTITYPDLPPSHKRKLRLPGPIPHPSESHGSVRPILIPRLLRCAMQPLAHAVTNTRAAIPPSLGQTLHLRPKNDAFRF